MRKLYLTLACLVTASAAARAAEPITQFRLATEGHRPQAIATGSDGNLWVTEVIKHMILRVTPEGTITEFPVPGKTVGVLQGIASGSDGQLYFTSREENSIRRMNVKGEFTGEFKIPSVATKPSQYNKGSWPREITAGPDGDLYFAEMAANKIGRISTKGEIKEYEIPTAESAPYGIVTGPDKKIWFTESQACKIGRLDPATGKIEEFALPTAKSLPRDMCVGPDGNIWFSENQADKIGRITPAGEIKEFDLPKGTAPIGIAAGGDGHIYFSGFKTHQLGRITTRGDVKFFSLPDKAAPFCLTAGPDGNIWIAEQGNAVARADIKALAK